MAILRTSTGRDAGGVNDAGGSALLTDALRDGREPGRRLAQAGIRETEAAGTGAGVGEGTGLRVPDRLVAGVFAGWVVGPEGCGIACCKDG
jgi:hypothetical protein